MRPPLADEDLAAGETGQTGKAGKAARADEPSRLQLRVHLVGLACLVGLVLAARLPALAPGSGPGFALLAALAAALVVDAGWSLWALRRRGLVVTATAPADGTVGAPAVVRLSVGGRRAPLLARISSVRAAPWLRLDAPQAGDVETRPERRGEFHSIEVTLAHNAPFGLVGALRTVPVTLPTPILVGPKPVPEDVADPPASGREPTIELEQASAPSTVGELVRGARPYQSGDSPRRVHWPLTARTGELMVRELDGVERPRIVVRVDLGPRPGHTAETVAGRAATVVHRLRDAGYPITLVTREASGSRQGPVDNAIDVGRRLARAVAGPPSTSASAERTAAGRTAEDRTAGEHTAAGRTAADGTAGQRTTRERRVEGHQVEGGTAVWGTPGERTAGKRTTAGRKAEEGTPAEHTAMAGTAVAGTAGERTAGERTAGQRRVEGHDVEGRTTVEGTAGQRTAGKRTSAGRTVGQRRVEGHEVEGGTTVEGTAGERTAGKRTSAGRTAREGTAAERTAVAGTAGDRRAGGRPARERTAGEGTAARQAPASTTAERTSTTSERTGTTAERTGTAAERTSTAAERTAAPPTATSAGSGPGRRSVLVIDPAGTRWQDT